MTRVHEDQSQAEGAAEGHHPLVAQPHSGEEGPIAEAEMLAAEMSSDELPLGSLGRRFNRRSPFYIGLTASAGVAVTYGMVRVLGSLSSMLVLIGVAFFLATGLEPAASWFVNRGLRRWLAISLVFVIFLAATGGFVAAAIPPLVQQAEDLIHQVPNYLQQARDHSSAIGRLNDRFHLQQGSLTRLKVPADPR
ncbi:MAG: AI-2E family transporter [Mycobacterium sp.]|uniref:AI-2E family transporter n=1 Tax=Mycobacterium sp. TaxID=1785 RepID=UPI003BB67D44